MDGKLKTRIEEAGYELSYDPRGDGNCFYTAAAHQLGLGWENIKNLVFDYLERNQIDVSIIIIINSFIMISSFPEIC